MKQWFIWQLSALAAIGVAAGAPPLTSKEQAAARKIYVAKCAKCHQFYDPKDYSEADWRKWMDSMSRKSKLKPDQEELLNRYLDSYRAGVLKKKPETK